VHAAVVTVRKDHVAAATVKLELERTGDETYVTIPSIAAWNGGYVTGVDTIQQKLICANG
jgi:hypothetical protein